MIYQSSKKSSKLYRSSEFSLDRRLCGRFALACVGLLLLLLCAPLRAQFSGPPTSRNPANNLPTTVTTSRTLLYPPVHNIELSNGDLLAIRIFGQADYTESVRVDTDGDVLLPLIGLVHLAGLSVDQSEQLIAERLAANGMYRDPQVTIQITEGPNAVVTVTGELHSIIPIAGSRRLLDVLSSAGGLPGSASHVITIHRPGLAEPIIVDLGVDPMSSQMADVPVFAGDTIVVSRIGIVYMLGSFKTPGTISLTPYQPLTLLQATALSGGPIFEAKESDMRIIRTVGDRRTVVKLNIHDVLFGKAPDPILQPNDIVFLPTSTLKASITNGTLGTVLGLTGLLFSIAITH
jgi:polysaccharide export outer membrane protein